MGNEKNRIQFLNARTHEEVGSVYLREEVVSLAISKDSQYALVNVRPSELQIWDIARQCLVRRFNGHRLSKHVIGCGFGGIDENFVLSGSEDGKIYIWHRATGRLIETLTGHEGGSVNAVAWHPKDPLTIASCGDDHTLCIWGPGGQRTSGPVVKHEAHSALDDSEPSGAANPIPWDSSDSPSVPEDELMRSAHDRLEMPASSPDV
jgi:WD40 repeat protein